MIKKIYGKHSFYFSIITILFSLTILIFENSLLNFNELIISIVCLFFILSIGISHGAMDNYKANKLLKIYKINNKAIFFIVYLTIAVFVILLWSLYASLTLLFFLLFASYHFGKEDTSFLHKDNSSMDQLVYLIKGSLIIFSPLFFHFDETLSIFETLFLSKKIIIFLDNEHWIINFCISFGILSYFYFAYKNKFEDFEIIFLDLLSILILNYVFTPLVAFTIYFCFLHSIRHSISLMSELDENNLSNGFKIFIKKALPLTIITAIFCVIGLYLLNNTYNFNSSILKIIFIGLASLTFPHILLEYLIEKNEK